MLILCCITNFYLILLCYRLNVMKIVFTNDQYKCSGKEMFHDLQNYIDDDHEYIQCLPCTWFYPKHFIGINLI